MLKHIVSLTTVILLSYVIISCSSPTDIEKPDSFVTSSIEEDYSSINNPLERWKAYNLVDYSIDAGWGVESYIPNIYTTYVINNKVKEIKYEISKDEYYGRTKEEIDNFIKLHAKTIDEVFFIIELNKNKAQRINVEYDARFGYPTKVYIDIDTLVADDEFLKSFSNLKRVIK